MESMLPALAFALLIGGQFLAAIVLISKRKTVYGGLEKPEGATHPPAEEIQSPSADEELPAKAA